MVEVVLPVFLLEHWIRAPDTVGPPAISFGRCALCCVLADQAFIGINKDCCIAAYLFLDPPPKRIVGVVGCTAIRQLHAGQPVGRIVAKDSCGVRRVYRVGDRSSISIGVITIRCSFSRDQLVVLVIRPRRRVVVLRLTVSHLVVGKSFGVLSVRRVYELVNLVVTVGGRYVVGLAGDVADFVKLIGGVYYRSSSLLRADSRQP